ncbi:HCP-like protein, partial [Acaromyces ingoldii]
NGGGAKGQPAATSQAEAFLTLGITHHESGDLSRSAYYFERSAKIDGGCVVGMCMWGMALREGWGARKDPRKGFEWISKAAARAGELMKPSGPGGVQQKSEAELKAIRSELKLSVYELGKCFCYGWGVKLDKLMALEYFELAAKLGDSDAQAEAGALLAAGKGGCKKDLRKAAMYYRMAEAQGYDTVGLSWIHKDKY